MQARRKDLPAALSSLKRAADLAPEAPRFLYAYAVALYSAGRTREARVMVEAALKRVPGDPSLNASRSRLAEEVRKR